MNNFVHKLTITTLANLDLKNIDLVLKIKFALAKINTNNNNNSIYANGIININ